MTGVDVLVVDFSGSGRFKPQSPRAKDACVVSMAAWMGYGVVAVSELVIESTVRSGDGRGRGGGNEKSLEFLSRFAVGDKCLVDITRNVTEVSNKKLRLPKQQPFDKSYFRAIKISVN